MNARLQMKLIKPAPTPGVERIPRKPVALTPIPWGTRDYATACAVLQNMVETTPGIHIRWTPNHSASNACCVRSASPSNNRRES